jgi:hypothetical protein
MTVVSCCHNSSSIKILTKASCPCLMIVHILADARSAAYWPLTRTCGYNAGPWRCGMRLRPKPCFSNTLSLNSAIFHALCECSCARLACVGRLPAAACVINNKQPNAVLHALTTPTNAPPGWDFVSRDEVTSAEFMKLAGGYRKIQCSVVVPALCMLSISRCALHALCSARSANEIQRLSLTAPCSALCCHRYEQAVATLASGAYW